MTSPDQTDLFETPLYPVRPVQQLDLDRFRLRMKTAMSTALDGLDRHAVSAEIGRMLGSQSMSKGMLDAYCSPAKDADISLVRFKALVRAIDAPALWDIAVSDDGLLVLKGDEARLAEIARLQQEQKAISSKLRRLRAVPVHIDRGSGA